MRRSHEVRYKRALVVFGLVEPTAFLPGLIGLASLTVALYLLSFRPLDRRAALLVVSVLLSGTVSALLFQTDMGLSYAAAVLGLGARVAAIAFIAIFPERLRWRSLSGAAMVVALLWLATSTVYVLSGQLPEPGTTTLLDRLLLPEGLGVAIVFLALVFARLRDLGSRLVAPARAASLFYLYPLGIVISGGGFVLAQTVGGLIGAGDYPLFLYTSGNEQTRGAGYVLASVILWWILPAALAIESIRRWRWWTPTLLFVAGFASYIPLLLRPDLDTDTIILLRGWGAFLAPGLIMYAQARYAPFHGEPVGLGPTLSVTAISALFAYAFVFVVVLVITPDEAIGYVAGPVLGFVAAVGTVALVLPRARKLELRRIFGAAADSESASLAPGRVVLGRYVIVRLIAEGGQGRVYEAKDKRSGARVVLKAVAGDGAVREARILHNLRHPNIVRLVDIVEVTGFTLVVLEYMGGGDLRGLLTRRGGRLPAQEALAIGAGVLAGLAEAHAQGVVHRDIKPENVLLDATDVPKLADFGAARLMAPDTAGDASSARDAPPGNTMRMGAMGTLAYLAPEQVRGELGDARSDVYAAAVLLHETITGERPIARGAGDDFLTRQAILTEPPRLSMPTEAASLVPVLERALAKDPAVRYANAGEMLTAFALARTNGA